MLWMEIMTVMMLMWLTMSMDKEMVVFEVMQKMSDKH